MRSIDINCDYGEGFGVYTIGALDAEVELLKHVTSVNIACGFHAGDPATMRRAVRQALAHGVATGAHPSFQDLAGFGRRRMSITPDEARDIVTYQIGALAAFVKSEGGKLSHVKPHGALYNLAAQDENMARAIALAVREIDDELILYALAGSLAARAGEASGLRVAHEAFADRMYEADGSLTARSEAHAVITDAEQAAHQGVRIATRGEVVTSSQTTLKMYADTLCIHGDTAHAAHIARRVRESLEAVGIEVMAIAGVV
ncbi:MAG: 5-oxoprolinase subunit PxpA [Pyrinomonadaceae bacterium MAG19_C2-C3]|nr:5-oxoprolinase subunit PxpA [Pyrinomonadaceae bacterium MAG19_C2-C3]